MAQLPHEGHKAMADPLSVFGISGKFRVEQALLVEEPPYQNWNHCGDWN
jgi:hypothetical protein